jgi:hypothetical protein
VGAPLVKAEQDRSIRVEDLTEVVMGGSRLRQAKQRLVPLEAASRIGNGDDRPGAPHELPPATSAPALCRWARRRIASSSRLSSFPGAWRTRSIRSNRRRCAGARASKWRKAFG